MLGAFAGLGSIAASPGGRQQIVSAAHSIAVSAGMARARAPQAGDYWSGCDAARAAGTAPIYRGEPGYRSGMDGDDDGIDLPDEPGPRRLVAGQKAVEGDGWGFVVHGGEVGAVPRILALPKSTAYQHAC